MAKPKKSEKLNKYEKREKLKEYLIEISKKTSMSKDYLNNLLVKFDKLYDKDFRHFYSDISSLILNSDIGMQIKSTDSTQSLKKDDILSLDQLGENIRILYEYAETINFSCKKEIEKLNDHITMDILRINYWKQMSEKYFNQINNTSSNIKRELTSLTLKTNSDMKETIEANYKEDLDKKLKETQKDYIAILGIFATIVLTFVTGFVFANISFQNLNNTSIYRLITGILLVGFILINMLCLLINFLENMNILPKLKNTNYTTLKNFKSINIIIFILLFFTIVSWFFDILEIKKSMFQGKAKLTFIKEVFNLFPCSLLVIAIVIIIVILLFRNRKK
ncbi:MULTISPECIES: hypothetical protein [Fusobacterium]|jgi:hypothetical protein|uniref:Uncharacterized protein n=1 Tax=Fusobacterium nucleatum subsp. polymorphum TaxID=76857 RepID=A0A2C6B3I1_FUSNP|nr:MULTISPECIES: hypothetical protein [Fusobacterium]EUB15739.1 endoplasmic reticulum-based factor for assembly of V-ATPase domain protein [Fusobacterium sp. CM22]PHH98431.1 hypothetical protein CA836_00865 [Fusobacterium polymorphum]